MEKCVIKGSGISSCLAKDCVFNENEKCHATTITVGGPEGPDCDTFVQASSKCGMMDNPGKVGVCKISDCRHNECYGCAAVNIKVQMDRGMPKCETFESR